MENDNYWSETQARETSSLEEDDSPVHDPKVIGRYRIIRRLGQGGFGRVYLAKDEDLARFVAIKVPNRERISGRADVENYLSEARALARLEHPNVVPVYDVGRSNDGLCFVVSKYVEGSDLANRLMHGRPSFRESVELVAIVADALHHAHTRGLVHRDIKPSNILIGNASDPWVADFGLALQEEDYGKGARMAGTPAYMSPEQARGEGHRVDGRSDIFSLGVVLYELLTGRRPFRGDTRTEIMDQIVMIDARPPRQIDDSIPRELERICQKAMAKRASERYSTGRDMAEDLRHFLESDATSDATQTEPSTIAPPPLISTGEPITPTPTPLPGRSESDANAVRIVPKGLRSFDRHDADFFLELLPGPRDREGLPDSIRFWKTRIESIDPDATFRVALIYGPSGCGKSSMVKAGLLPRLAKHVLPVYIEATPGDTEARLLKGIAKVCPDLRSIGGITDALTTLRRGSVLRSGHKVLLVIDQFEQWLFGRRDESNSELVSALRQCDGEHVQAVVMVRDDFWMAATRFMRDLEIRLVEGENSGAVDLFNVPHARRVLTALGRAYGALPEKSSELTSEQRVFLEQSVAGLAQGGKVISVRLALFAEMVKGKSWTPSTLKEVGGAQGVGVTFLDETFSATTAPPDHRFHQRAAQAVLRSLLPQSGTDIKGQMRSEAELREASGYSNRPRDFNDLIGILDGELRLITPTDPEGIAEEGQATKSGDRFYQLTHDYLVHSLREWLSRKQKETRRGRAELRLAERAAIWDARPENRHLPSATEWANIRSLTLSKNWTDPQRRMMRRAGKVHGLRAIATAVVGAVGIGVGVNVWNRVAEANQAKLAAGHVVQLLTADTLAVPGQIAQLSPFRRWIDPELNRLLAEPATDPKTKLHASLALLPVDPTQVASLEARLLQASPKELIVLRDVLKPYSDQITENLWAELARAQASRSTMLPAAGALAALDPDDQRWSTFGAKVAQQMVALNPFELASWLDALRPVRLHISKELEMRLRGGLEPEAGQMLAASILADYSSDDPGLLAELMLSGSQPFRALWPVVQQHADQAVPRFAAAIAGPENGSPLEELKKDPAAQRQARAAIALVRLGHGNRAWHVLTHQPDPRLRSYVISWVKSLGVDPRQISAELDRLDGESQAAPAVDPNPMNGVLFHRNNSIRRALILALGTYGSEELPEADRERLINKLSDLYHSDPDAGIHGAAEWALRHWKQQKRIETIDTELRDNKDRGLRRWFVNREGQTFAVINGPVDFRIGSPETDTEQLDEPQSQVLIPRRFAIATKEVTVAEFRRFTQVDPYFQPDGEYDKAQKEYSPDAYEKALKDYSPDAEDPWIGAPWYAAAAYCNWLSKQEGLPEKEWCYQSNKVGKYDEGMTVPANVLQRKGYRLPTEAEWEYACRAGTSTPRYYGVSIELLGNYGWYLTNEGQRTNPVGRLIPNDLGLFDMLGNVAEWCQDVKSVKRPVIDGRICDNLIASEQVSPNSPRIFRGGMFAAVARNLRSAQRDSESPAYSNIAIGFRIARTYP